MSVLTEPETTPHEDNDGDPQSETNLNPTTGVLATHRVTSDGPAPRSKRDKQKRLEISYDWLCAALIPT